ncbi:hypothetical protein [Streptomyces odonnellii]|uniref:hypothetical protein n=1 Tax=Streptomyces odonnellii TaxID=1417980 RepID=UPI0006252C76|nr:hypothetical protein [Streptomyces odonnellii]
MTAAAPSSDAPKAPAELARALTAWAKGHGPMETAIDALVEEATVLARRDVQAILVRTDSAGERFCDWVGMATRLYHVRMTAPERAFLTLVMSLASPPYEVHLGRALADLDEDRARVVFKAMRRAARARTGG